jgi:hypothetical protein
MIELSVVRDLVAIFGVIAGFSYYVLTVRNSQRSQQISRESQQLQLLMQLASFVNIEFSKNALELINMEWTDFDDFERKYGSDFNPDNYAKRQAIWSAYDTLGQALKRGLIDRDLLFERVGNTPMFYWKKFEDVIKEIRRRYNQPLSMINLEYLAEESRRYMQERGFDATIPDTFYRYVPDKQ